MPKVFISHSWEDNELSRIIAQYLKEDGAEIGIDYFVIQDNPSISDKPPAGLSSSFTNLKELCYGRHLETDYWSFRQSDDASFSMDRIQ